MTPPLPSCIRVAKVTDIKRRTKRWLGCSKYDYYLYIQEVLYLEVTFSKHVRAKKKYPNLNIDNKKAVF